MKQYTRSVFLADDILRMSYLAMLYIFGSSPVGFPPASRGMFYSPLLLLLSLESVRSSFFWRRCDVLQPGIQASTSSYTYDMRWSTIQSYNMSNIYSVIRCRLNVWRMKEQRPLPRSSSRGFKMQSKAAGDCSSSPLLASQIPQRRNFLCICVFFACLELLINRVKPRGEGCFSSVKGNRAEKASTSGNLTPSEPAEGDVGGACSLDPPEQWQQCRPV